MTTAAGSLQELHRLHNQLAGVEDEIARGPKKIQARRRIVERKRAEIEEMKDQLKHLRMSADEKSLQLKTNEGKIADLKTKLNAAQSNREFDIFKSQIDADSMANSVLEDEILEAYDKVDAVQSGISDAETGLTNAVAEEEQISKEFAEISPALESRCKELQGALKAAETGLPGSVALVYRRLVAAHGASALAAVENKACSACFATVTANLLVEINVGKFVYCRSCGRLMYRVTDD